MDTSAKSAGSGTQSGQGPGEMPAGSAGGDTAVLGPPPNILFILVDELRFPKWVFPEGMGTRSISVGVHLPDRCKARNNS